jgi:galactonate dehydratase
VTHHEAMQIKPLRTLDDVTELGREVAASGMTALKTNVMIFGDDAHMHVPGFARAREGFPALNAERREINAIKEELAAFREGTGPDIDILVDLNFNYKTEGFRKMARAMEPFDLFWVEIDCYSPAALRTIRDSTIIPLASGECLFHRRGYQPFFERQAMDTVIIDTPWNGVAESLKIASVADTYEINVAPHNFYGHLATMMNAHFCALVPNFRIMEIDLDRAPWYDDLVTVPSRIEDGYLVLPDGPGWGTDVNEEAVRAHPPR